MIFTRAAFGPGQVTDARVQLGRRRLDEQSGREPTGSFSQRRAGEPSTVGSRYGLLYGGGRYAEFWNIAMASAARK
ncbi:hypothetical protein [Streptomyces sp. NPDC093105]|uniref:hypothetical protein n=1 Tax=Streptomyces sp. NPDC093105 TaxID=3366029 RepID=UPI003830186B